MVEVNGFGAHAHSGLGSWWIGFSIFISKLLCQYFLSLRLLWSVMVFWLLTILSLAFLPIDPQSLIHIILLLFWSTVLGWFFWVKFYFLHSWSVHIEVIIGILYRVIFTFVLISYVFLHKLRPVTLWPDFLSTFQNHHLDWRLFS